MNGNLARLFRFQFPGNQIPQSYETSILMLLLGQKVEKEDIFAIFVEEKNMVNRQFICLASNKKSGCDMLVSKPL